MTEYIAEFTVEKKPLDFPNLMIHTHGELVRCRYCKHYDQHPTDGGVCFLPDGDGDFARWEVEPDGYCKWGERQDA